MKFLLGISYFSCTEMRDLRALLAPVFIANFAERLTNVAIVNLGNVIRKYGKGHAAGQYYCYVKRAWFWKFWSLPL